MLMAFDTNSVYPNVIIVTDSSYLGVKAILPSQQKISMII